MPCNCKVFYNPFVCFLCEQHKDWVHSLNALNSVTRAIVKRRVSKCLVLDIITHISLFIALLTSRCLNLFFLKETVLPNLLLGYKFAKYPNLFLNHYETLPKLITSYKSNHTTMSAGLDQNIDFS